MTEKEAKQQPNIPEPAKPEDDGADTCGQDDGSDCCGIELQRSGNSSDCMDIDADD